MSKPLMILDPQFRTIDELFDPRTLAQLEGLCRIEGGDDAPMAEDRRAELLKDVEFLVAARPALSEADVFRAAKLRAVIEVAGAFHGEIDYAACFDQGIEVLSCAPGFRFSVAEMGLAMLLSAARGLVAEHERFRDGHEQWLSDRPATDFTLYNQRIGFVGYGNIARELHRLLHPFNPELLAFDPWIDAFPDDVTPATLEEMFESCRAVIVTAVPSEENLGMIDAALIDVMPSGAALVLLSRAHVLDFGAAAKAAEERRITFATDVYPQEPVEGDAPIRKVPQIILSPHRAAAVPGGRQAIGRFVLHDVNAILEGRSERKLLEADRGRVAGLVQAQNRIEQAANMTRR